MQGVPVKRNNHANLFSKTSSVRGESTEVINGAEQLCHATGEQNSEQETTCYRSPTPPPPKKKTHSSLSLRTAPQPPPCTSLRTFVEGKDVYRHVQGGVQSSWARRYHCNL
jgi:hypothetical protein